MRIVLLGAPGSGKGTQAALLEQRLGVPHISTGVLLRSAVEQQTSLGLKAKAIMDRGELVPDDVMLNLIEERLGQPDTAEGFILDGYPRNVAQAQALDTLLERLGCPLDHAILIDVNEGQVAARIAKRAAEEGRSDDTEEVVAKRLRVYRQQTAPVADHYLQQGLLTRVLGEGAIPEVLQRITGALKSAQYD